VDIWKDGQLKPDVPTIVGAMILGVTFATDGHTDQATYFLAQVDSMTRSLGWYGPPMGLPEDLNTVSANQLKAESHAAWGIFNYTT
jgi:hypothetical protein